MLSIQAVAARLALSDDSIYRLIDAGELRAIDVRATGTAAQLRISEAELDRFILARTLPAVGQ
jgi:excisionase family DNA binding protein